MRSPLAKPTAFAVQKPRFASLDVDECARCPYAFPNSPSEPVIRPWRSQDGFV